MRRRYGPEALTVLVRGNHRFDHVYDPCVVAELIEFIEPERHLRIVRRSPEIIELGDVLKLAGVKFGEQLRGKDLALFLVVGAADGYHAVFALPELDHAFTDRIVILADRRDGKPLAEKEGPLRIVVPDEKREARWVRQVISLTIRRVQ